MTESSLRKTQILVVEDDPQTASQICRSLENGGASLTSVSDGVKALEMLKAHPWDLIVLDRMLPGFDGLSLLCELRRIGRSDPVLLLTAIDSTLEKVRGFNLGADGYLAKPFDLRELVARAGILLRPGGNRLCSATKLTFEDLELDVVGRKLSKDGRRVHLQPQEFKLLEFFMKHPERILTREMIFASVWGIEFPVRSNFLESHISRLRQKTGNPSGPLIHTLKGEGYVLGTYRTDEIPGA
ncbi:two component response regulator [Acetobacter aceti NRIC 0242]|uniref:DNA-binding response regulator n=1 Tax=Acetobacter aceti NBRC 14818 TaxID=887700 RepID=A0AB33IGK6_ACEAC|nr:response regulator transcription factor [Acetobacter aceti]TCS31988.1 two-component system OmpR family response regulator [Acetobacter aceti NBRC 14818]BCK77290.1 DNA-binding response regulator [Acetobacter aceti NBRC 14818]GAN58385.1 two component transcriptional regulator [Acetobacter aceti NBRC 14818]GBO81648.1 two component response regulator [Acetobacter aceti NRIC 0242]